MYSIMILGTGVMQLPAYRAAGRNGWYSIGVDRDPHGPAVPLADRFEQVDLADREGVLEVAERYLSAGRLDGVFTAGTDFSSTVAYVTERLGLPGIPYEAALRATDKGKMRECFRAAGVPSPRFRLVDARDLNVQGAVSAAIVAEFTTPFVVKPVDNMGARGVRLIDRPEELKGALEDAIGLSRTGRAIVEELIPGREYSVDALVYKDEILVTGVADRHIHFAPYFIEMGHTIPSKLDGPELDELIAVFEYGVRALGINLGAAKGDVFLGPRGAVIGEIAARLSGGYMSGWTYPLCSGVELTEAGMRVALGLDPRALVRPRCKRVTAERAVISIPGLVRELNGTAAGNRHPGVEAVFERVKPGDEVRFPRNNVEKCANVIAAGNSRAEAIERAMRAIREFRMVLEPGRPDTAAFLFGAETPVAHYAVQLQSERTRHTLAAMPAVLESPGPQPARLCVCALAGLEDEDTRDWRGLTPAETLAELRLERSFALVAPQELEPYSAEATPEPGSESAHAMVSAVPVLPVLGGVFWRAFIVGGLQGACFLIDTITECNYEIVEREILRRYRPLYGDSRQ